MDPFVSARDYRVSRIIRIGEGPPIRVLQITAKKYLSPPEEIYDAKILSVMQKKCPDQLQLECIGPDNTVDFGYRPGNHLYSL